MLFVFPRRQVGIQSFVMRDCLVDIDIIFLDPKLRITQTHEMKVEPPRQPHERVTPNPDRDPYYRRLKRYSSKFPAQFAIELKGGTLERMRKDPEIAAQLRPGQVIELDAKELIGKAR